jgi:acetyl-CoA C-acetyltransferase
MGGAYIYDHVRTPRGRGKPDGSLHSVTPIQLAAQILRTLRDRNSLDTALIDDVVLGCVAPVGEQGSNIARVAALVAGFDERVAGVQLNRFCASGLEAVNTAAAQIMSGQSDLVIGGGIESMSRVPIGSDGGAWSTDPSVAYSTYFAPQGIGADLIATLDGHSRMLVDAYALESQRRAALAWRERRFQNSVIPVHDLLGRIALDHDEHMRPLTTMENLAALKPAFAVIGAQAGFDAIAIQRYPNVEALRHVHTAGNSSGIVDGAAAVLLGSKEMSARLRRPPRARVVGFASIGSEPTIMLTGPADAARKALRRARMTVKDVDLFEVNEAFASVVLHFIGELGVDPTLVNVNGGAIAMGHPLGATGAMLLGTVLDELERRHKTVGLITLCVGAGMGTATIIERL